MQYSHGGIHYAKGNLPAASSGDFGLNGAMHMPLITLHRPRESWWFPLCENNENENRGATNNEENRGLARRREESSRLDRPIED